MAYRMCPACGLNNRAEDAVCYSCAHPLDQPAPGALDPPPVPEHPALAGLARAAAQRRRVSFLEGVRSGALAGLAAGIPLAALAPGLLKEALGGLSSPPALLATQVALAVVLGLVAALYDRLDQPFHTTVAGALLAGAAVGLLYLLGRASPGAIPLGMADGALLGLATGLVQNLFPGRGPS